MINPVSKPYRRFSVILGVALALSVTSAPAVEIVKSAIDEKSYRYVELDNRLKVLLVSDPKADKSAASLDVHVGSGSDPEDWYGLAHFLEHMLFLGTEKYPDAGGYQAFIKDNGGSNNAYTSFDHTNYYFSIPNAHFEQALDRFSRFFIDPTFDGLYVDRERQVVHSEYQARKKDEGRRIWDARKVFINPEHPASGFSVGSLDTLADREGASARDLLIDFFHEHYSANIMTLTVLGPEPLDDLERMARNKFSEIPDRDAIPQSFDIPYLRDGVVGQRLDAVPEIEKNSVSFQFPIPSTKKAYRAKPVSYIANLLGHEGEGSLLWELKRRGLAESLSAGQGYVDDQIGIFNVYVGLTSDGLDHIDEIGDLLFEEINLIREKGVAQWRFDEQSSLGDVSFRFSREPNAGALVRSLSSRLHLYDPEDVLRGPHMMTEFDQPTVREILDLLRPDNVFIQVVSRDLETDNVTSFYDVAYAVSDIDSDWIEKWKSLDGPGDLALPEPNPFVPERLDLLALGPSTETPTLTEIPPGIEFWYQADQEFGAPKASFFFSVLSPVANADARNAVLTELYVSTVNEQLSDIVYPAYLADLSYSLYRHRRGISVRIEGFEDRQDELLAQVLEAMLNVNISVSKFAVIKDRLRRELENVTKDSPSGQSVHEMYRLLLDPYWTESERLSVLDGVELEDVLEFAPQLFESVKVRVLAHGDVSREAAARRAAMVADLFGSSEFLAEVPRPEIRRLHTDDVYLRTMLTEHPDAALARYFQGRDNSRDERAIMALLRHVIESPFYNDLRTVNRVGYLVFASSIDINRTPGLLLSVQSPSHSPSDLDKLFSAFLDNFDTQLKEMPESQFEAARTGLIDTIERRDKNLGERSSRYWREIDLEETGFDTRQKFVEAVRDISLDQLRAYYQTVILDGGGELFVQLPGGYPGERAGALSKEGFVSTGDATEFRVNFN